MTKDRFDHNKRPEEQSGPVTGDDVRDLPLVGRSEATKVIREALYSQDVAQRISALKGLAASGTSSPALLDRVTQLVGNAHSTDEPAEACRTLLSPHHDRSLIGIQIEGIARYLAFLPEDSPLDTAKRALTFLSSCSDTELLLSPTIFALSALNPYLRQRGGELGEIGEIFLSRVTSDSSVDNLASQLRKSQKLGWAKGLAQTIDILLRTTQSELQVRAQLFKAADDLKTLNAQSAEALALRHHITRICTHNAITLLSQSMGDRVAGVLTNSSDNSIGWLTGSVGAASAEQLIRIALQPLPIRELKFGFHHDNGTFGAGARETRPLELRLKTAMRWRGLQEFTSEGPQLEVPEEHPASIDEMLLSEFAGREMEIIKNDQFNSTCLELDSVLRSPAIYGVETLSIPDSLLDRLRAEDFPFLRRVDIFRSEEVRPHSCGADLLSNIDALGLSNMARLGIIQKGTDLSNIRHIELCEGDECYTFSQLARRYNLKHLESVSLGAAPSAKTLAALLQMPTLSTLRFPWGDDLDGTQIPGQSAATRLEIKSLSGEGLLALSGIQLDKVKCLSLRDLQSTAKELLPLLDRLNDGQLEGFEISTNKTIGLDLYTVLNHPALKNVSYLTLGVPGVVNLIRGLSNIPCPMQNLHSVGFENDSARHLESGHLSEVEIPFIDGWFKKQLFEVRYPWPLSTTSHLENACHARSEKLLFATSQYTVTKDLNPNRWQAQRFLIARED